MNNAWDRAVAAEARRCRRLEFIFQQPSCDRQDGDYHAAAGLVKLGNVRGMMATYRVGPTGRIARERDADGGASCAPSSCNWRGSVGRRSSGRSGKRPRRPS